MSRFKALALAAGTVSILTLPAIASSHLVKTANTKPSTVQRTVKPKLFHKEVKPVRRHSR
jgi:hypothetical protein